MVVGAAAACGDVRVIVRAQVTKVDLYVCINVIGCYSLADPSRMSAPELQYYKTTHNAFMQASQVL